MNATLCASATFDSGIIFAILSQTLLQLMLQPEQRGVCVGCSDAGPRPTLLVAVQWGRHSVDVVSTAKRYSLDITKVDNATRDAALSLLGKMNFDQRFQLADGYP